MDLLERRTVRLERVAESLARELLTEDILLSAERESYRRLVNGALLKLHKGWGILRRALGRRARRGA